MYQQSRLIVVIYHCSNNTNNFAYSFHKWAELDQAKFVTYKWIKWTLNHLVRP